MLRIAAGVTGTATMVLLAGVVIRELRAFARLRASTRRRLIDEASAEEQASDVALWDAELEASA